MSVPECSNISFISSASLIRYEGVFAGYDAPGKKLKASSLRVCGTEDRLPEAEKKPPSNLLLKEIEVEVDTIFQLHGVGHKDTLVTVRDRTSNAQFQGTLVAHVPSSNTVLLTNCKPFGPGGPVPSIIKVDTLKADCSLPQSSPCQVESTAEVLAEGESECPLCLESYDVTDQHFQPCACGYRLCVWCFHTLQESTSLGPARCPNCRASYSQRKMKFERPDAKQVELEIVRQKRQQNPRRYLPGLLVVCRNLVSLFGLPSTICKPTVLRQHQWLGQYGRILTLTVNTQDGSAQALYQSEADAITCIKCVDGVTLEGQLVRAFIGVTKYCPVFLKTNAGCAQLDCTLLHTFVDDSLICLPLHMERQRMAPPPQRKVACRRSLPPPNTLEPGIPEPLDARAFTKAPPRKTASPPASPSMESSESSLPLGTEPRVADEFGQRCDELLGHELYERELIYDKEMQEREDLISLRTDVMRKIAKPRPPQGLFQLNSAQIRGRTGVTQQEEVLRNQLIERFNTERSQVRVWRKPPPGPPPEQLKLLEEEEKKRRWQERNERLKKEYLEQQQRRKEQEEQQKSVREPVAEPEPHGKGQGKGKGMPRLPQPTLFDYLKGNKQAALKPSESPAFPQEREEENVQLQRPQGLRRPGAQYAVQQESSAVARDIRSHEDEEYDRKGHDIREYGTRKEWQQGPSGPSHSWDSTEGRRRDQQRAETGESYREGKGKGGKGKSHQPVEVDRKAEAHKGKRDTSEGSRTSSDEDGGQHRDHDSGGKGSIRPGRRLYDPDEETDYRRSQQKPEGDDYWASEQPKKRDAPPRYKDEEGDWSRGKGYRGGRQGAESYDRQRPSARKGKREQGYYADEGSWGKNWDESHGGNDWYSKEEAPPRGGSRESGHRCHMDNYDDRGKPVKPEYVSPKEDYYANWGYGNSSRNKGLKEGDWWGPEGKNEWGKGGNGDDYGRDYAPRRRGNRSRWDEWGEWDKSWDGWDKSWDSWGKSKDDWGKSKEDWGKGKEDWDYRNSKGYGNWEDKDAWGYERGGYYDQKPSGKGSRKGPKERSGGKDGSQGQPNEEGDADTKNSKAPKRGRRRGGGEKGEGERKDAESHSKEWKPVEGPPELLRREKGQSDAV